MQKIIFFGDQQYGAIVAEALIAQNFSLTPYTANIQIPQDAIGVVASYGAILPKDLIDKFAQGIVCLHPSLLPQYRGATPAPYAIALGEKTTGITLFFLTEKVDQGQIITQAKATIDPSDTAPTLLRRLFRLGADLLINWLTTFPDFKPQIFPLPKDTQLIFTRRFRKESGYIEWPTFTKLINHQLPLPHETQNPLLSLRLAKETAAKTEILHDLIRALTPWPGVWTIAPTKKGPLRLAITQANPSLMVKLEGKPRPIHWQDFHTYYL